MRLLAYIRFCYKNYVREHRYIRDLVAIVIFSIFFGGFLNTPGADESVWIALGILAIILNLMTTPALLFFEEGNTLHFLISKPGGRLNLLKAKVLLATGIDLAWVALLAIVYGLRFFSWEYFMLLPLRLLIIGWLLLLSSLLISLMYTYRSHLFWLIFLLVILGSITPKYKAFTEESVSRIVVPLVFFLPPFQELISYAAGFSLDGWSILFLSVALGQTLLLAWMNRRRMLGKDLV